MIDNELILWEKQSAVQGFPYSTVIRIGPLRTARPDLISIWIYAKTIVIAGSYVVFNLRARPLGGNWIGIQTNLFTQSDFDKAENFVISIPSWSHDDIQMYVQDATGFTSGLISAGINIDQQTNG